MQRWLRRSRVAALMLRLAPAAAGRRGEQADPRQRGAAQARRDQALGAAGQHRFRHRRRRGRQSGRRHRDRGTEEARRGDRDRLRPRRPPATTSSRRFTGTGKGKVLLMAHMDTVFAKGTAAARPFRIEGGRAYGPGVSDDKAGIVVALVGAENPRRAEVQGLRAHHAVAQHQRGDRLARLARADREARQGARRHAQSRSRPRRRRHHDLAQGLRHHQGRGQGPRLACRRLRPSSAATRRWSWRIRCCSSSKLANAEKGTTINFTVIKAGDRKNVIPDYAVADADVRARGHRGVRPRRARACRERRRTSSFPTPR